MKPDFGPRVGGHCDRANAHVLHAGRGAAQHVVLCALRYTQGFGAERGNYLLAHAQQQRYPAHHTVSIGRKVHRTQARGTGLQHRQWLQLRVKTMQPALRVGFPQVDNAVGRHRRIDRCRRGY